MGLRVAGIQMDVAWEQPEVNLERAASLVGRAARDGARLIVLPEMFATGFSMRAEAMAAHAGSIREQMASLAATHDVWIAAGYVEPARPLPFNASEVWDPKGESRAFYRKIHPFTFAGEHEHYAAGDELVSVEIEGLRVTPVICYDLRFPELFRARAQSTDLFLVIANWPSARRMHWRTLLRARAIENQAYVLGVNRVGEGDGLTYSGDSALIDPLGERHGDASGEPAIVLMDADAARVRQVRDRFSFLSDRRASTYAAIEERPQTGAVPVRVRPDSPDSP